MKDKALRAIAELGAVSEAFDYAQIDAAVKAIMDSNRIALYGVGREGLQIRGLAMRLFHLGCNASVVGDMTTPALSQGDLLVVSAGPGHFSTVEALMRTAAAAGARTLCVTASPEASLPRLADIRFCIPAQTMADDQGDTVSVLPMGSLYEGAQYVLFEILILALRDAMGLTTEDMRKNHTNLE
ncbi:SIS domain-containing protein [Paracoccus onubensis]|uniref:SIS domain-containing protein n=1 Tax=Paracoccus onubensis TaxID=1675788 RepID=A0A418T886_9RHOB|nr:SIS domain-containing protein [Paracoccus onubensis]RJE89320.1 SIS domain-containing protein [Paracoccus onubensis]